MEINLIKFEVFNYTNFHLNQENVTEVTSTHETTSQVTMNGVAKELEEAHEMIPLPDDLRRLTMSFIEASAHRPRMR